MLKPISKLKTRTYEDIQDMTVLSQVLGAIRTGLLLSRDCKAYPQGSFEILVLKQSFQPFKMKEH